MELDLVQEEKSNFSNKQVAWKLMKLINEN